MSLKVELKPGERLIVGDCIITNSDQRARLYFDGRTPILREKDILSAETANTPCKRIYFTVQMMYLEDDIEKLRQQYFDLTADLVQAAPSTFSYIEKINNQILTGSLYKALKTTKELIEYERGLLNNAATSGTGLSADGQTDS